MDNVNFRSINCCSCPFYMIFLTIFIILLSLSQLFESSVIEEVGSFGLIPSTLRNPKKFVRVDGGELGIFIGTEEELTEGSSAYYSFLGIPYGKARRWEDPKPVEIRTRGVDCTRYRPICPHWSHKEKKGLGHIDCLFLNVFTPHLPTKNTGKYLNLTETARKRFLKPVIVYFDSRYSAESTEHNYKPEGLMGNYDTLFININYRTGVHGFLSNNNRSLAGNYGLLDQLASLRWIKKNIGRFGGNPLKVTIMGNVKYILVSPLSKGLFHRAVILSEFHGKLLSNFHFKLNDQFTSAELLGKKLGCSFESESTLLDCLKITPMDKILEAEHLIFKMDSIERISPTIDEGIRPFPVLPLHPIDLIENGNFTKVPIMFGTFVDNENSLARTFFRDVIRMENDLPFDFLNNTESKLDLYERLFEFLKEVLEASSLELNEKDFKNIWEYYFENDFKVDQDNSTIFNRMSKMFDDFQIYFPNWRLIQKLAKNLKIKPFYIYMLNYKDEQKSYSGSSTRENSFREIDILRLRRRNKEDIESLTQENLWKIFTAFSEFGIPKSAISSFGNWTTWKRVDFKENYFPFYDLNQQGKNTFVNYRKNEALFWEGIYDSIVNGGNLFLGSLKLNILCIYLSFYNITLYLR